MARLPRIVIPNISHHVSQRGNRRQLTFFCDDDYQSYLSLMSQQCKRYGLSVLAYCLMPNHVHIVAVPPKEEALRLAIGGAHEAYSKQVNYRMGWSGHLWQGRFFSAPMDDSYMLHCIRYVELNPVRAGLTKNAEDYRWSSAKAHILNVDDALVHVKPMTDRYPDWRAFLDMEFSPKTLEILRKHSRIGRPMGNEKLLKNGDSRVSPC